ncbi:MAG: squalene synthase HpnC [Dongiaceae bacterium]
MQNVTSAIETPSGKSASGENFPVGSWLLPPRLRPHVAIFYGFARAIDDIADSPALAPADKTARLDGFAATLSGQDAGPGFEKARRLRASLVATQVPIRHGLDLIAAFKQDAVKLRYAGWDDLMGYCILSAAPVGRYLLDLHGEAAGGYEASDALCNALQVLNHLQDCQDDYRQLNRIYLPLRWMQDAGAGIEDLDQPRSSIGLRQVIDHCLDGVAVLMIEARQLPAQLASRRLAMETAVIVRIADRLCQLLRHGDPLAGRVALSKMQFGACGTLGIADILLRRRRAPIPPSVASPMTRRP